MKFVTYDDLIQQGVVPQTDDVNVKLESVLQLLTIYRKIGVPQKTGIAKGDLVRHTIDGVAYEVLEVFQDPYTKVPTLKLDTNTFAEYQLRSNAFWCEVKDSNNKTIYLPADRLVKIGG